MIERKVRISNYELRIKIHWFSKVFSIRTSYFVTRTFPIQSTNRIAYILEQEYEHLYDLTDLLEVL